MSIIKKILFCLVFISVNFFLFRNDVLATNCLGNNGITYKDGDIGITSAACFNSGSSYCTEFISVLGSADGKCQWSYDSTCECQDGSWIKRGSGCVGNLSCNNAAGWYSTCASGNCSSSYILCNPCGNNRLNCYKNTTNLSIVCKNDSDCGAGKCCKNPGTTSSTCSSDCGGTSSGSSCSTPSGGACDNAGGTCSTTAIANTTTQSGLCPSTSDCLCRIPKSDVCQPNSNSCASLGGTCGSPNRSGTTHYNLCTGSSDCVCVAPCVPNCSTSSNYCSSQTFSDGCGSTCTGTKAVTANDIGTCGTADTSGTAYSVAPSGSVLCADSDTPSAVSSTSTSYTWTCTGVAGSCVATQNLVTNCSATRDDSPIFHSFNIKNTSDILVAAESGNNHICQSDFTADTARFEVIYTDNQTGADINQIRLKIGSQTFTDTILTVSGNNATAVFDIPRSSISSTDLQSISVSASDNHSFTGSVTNFYDTNRDFKYWDCKVPISGTFYDGSAGMSCPTTGFSILADRAALNLTSLTFNKDGVVLTMPLNSDGISYNSGTANALTWGTNGYIPNLNNNIALTLPKMRSQSSSSTTQFCDWYIDTTDVDPYTANPSFTADFSGIVNQDPWWQVINGGVISNTSVKNRVPITCTTANCKISPFGLVSAPTIDNIGRSPSDAQDWYYGNISSVPNTNAKLAISNTSYSYFLTQYYAKNSIGTVLTGNKTIADIDATGIYFVDGNLTIDTDKTVAAGDFLMIIVKGDINVNENVKQVDGILVANNIIAAGSNNNQLVFNGSLYASGDISFSRSYTTKLNNNTSPAIVVNYNPAIIFKLPGSLSKVLTNWQWGN